MIRRRVSGSVTETAKSIIPFAANATKSVPRSKVLFLGMFAPLLAAVAVQILFRADMPSITADGTLNCYDSAGNYEPCATRARASASQLMAEQRAPLNQQVGRQPRCINKHFGQHPQSINRQIGQQAQSIDQQIGDQAHQPHGAVIRQENAQRFAGDV